MGRKCLVSLMAKMMLGMRKKVQHPRLNQKAFCKERARGSLLSCMRQPPGSRGVWGALWWLVLVCVWGGVRAAVSPGCPKLVLISTMQVPTRPPWRDRDRILTQGSAMRSHRITRPLSRAVASGWHEATSSLSWNKKRRQGVNPLLAQGDAFCYLLPWLGEGFACSICGGSWPQRTPCSEGEHLPSVRPSSGTVRSTAAPFS